MSKKPCGVDRRIYEPEIQGKSDLEIALLVINLCVDHSSSIGPGKIIRE